MSLVEPVHLRLVRREEDVRRRSLLDLPREEARRAEVERDFLSRVLLVGLRQLLERIGQAGGGEDLELLRRGGSGERECRQEYGRPAGSSRRGHDAPPFRTGRSAPGA